LRSVQLIFGEPVAYGEGELPGERVRHGKAVSTAKQITSFVERKHRAKEHQFAHEFSAVSSMEAVDTKILVERREGVLALRDGALEASAAVLHFAEKRESLPPLESLQPSGDRATLRATDLGPTSTVWLVLFFKREANQFETNATNPGERSENLLGQRLFSSAGNDGRQ